MHRLIIHNKIYNIHLQSRYGELTFHVDFNLDWILLCFLRMYVQVWHDIKVSKWCKHFHFWVNCSFEKVTFSFFLMLEASIHMAQVKTPPFKNPQFQHLCIPLFFSSPIHPSLPLGIPASSTPSYSYHHSLILKTDSKLQPITHTKKETRAKMALGSVSEWHLKHFLCVLHPSTGASWGSIYLEEKTISHQRNEFVSFLFGSSRNICVK